MSEIIERVARALSIADACDPDAQQIYPIKVYTAGRRTDTGHDSRVSHIEDLKAPPQWHAYVRNARAAILAMREPTDEMADAGESSLICGPMPQDVEDSPTLTWAHAKSCYRAMIEKAACSQVSALKEDKLAPMGIVQS